MRILLTTVLIWSLSSMLLAQTDHDDTIHRRYCITIGILQGGGSLIGADFEFLITQKLGVQAGLGFVGFGAGLNYHLKPSIHSSFFSVQYWNQGIGKSFAQNVIGTTYVYRISKWFTFQIGLGVPLEEGPAMPEDFKSPPVILLFSIGAFFLV